MVTLKSCPRCRRGDLFLDRFGEITCIQCGYELPQAARAQVLTAAERPRRLPSPVMQAA